MANRLYTSQFSYSLERMPVDLMGSITQTGSTGTFATRATQGVTLTAVTMGTIGNSITIAFTPGATAGAEVVTVTGSAISVQIETGVSSITQVRAAINASTSAAALVTATGTSASAVSTASALALTTGTDTPLTSTMKGATVLQTGTGLFTITLADPYTALLGCDIMLQKASATDIKPQLKSVDTTTAQTIVFRTIAVGTNTNLSSGDVMYIRLTLRNSSS